ncbi:STAS domain-containing protein [Kitasatospora sp. NPDC056327]|uniref:STAS domain-containing protein n=1 Tax=Kitasatospora sp. NPDC056327 TaxID=3345785 RepID=UPI0035E198EE
MARRPPGPLRGDLGHPGPDPGLTTRTRPWAGGTLLTLCGELDLDTVPVLRAALDPALAGPGGTVLIDCADLSFCDSTGLSALLEAAGRATACGGRLELVRPRPLVRRVLELTGATDAFRVLDDLPLRSATPRPGPDPEEER